MSGRRLRVWRHNMALSGLPPASAEAFKIIHFVDHWDWYAFHHRTVGPGEIVEKFGQFNPDVHTICDVLADEALVNLLERRTLHGFVGRDVKALVFVFDGTKPILEMDVFFSFMEDVLPHLTKGQILETLAFRNQEKADQFASSISEGDQKMHDDVLDPTEEEMLDVDVNSAPDELAQGCLHNLHRSFHRQHVQLRRHCLHVLVFFRLLTIPAVKVGLFGFLLGEAPTLEQGRARFLDCKLCLHNDRVGRRRGSSEYRQASSREWQRGPLTGAKRLACQDPQMEVEASL